MKTASHTAKKRTSLFAILVLMSILIALLSGCRFAGRQTEPGSSNLSEEPTVEATVVQSEGASTDEITAQGNNVLDLLNQLDQMNQSADSFNDLPEP